MAPLRSSRSTRNQDHQAASRSRGIIDLDPTEGLPVQKWEQISIKVNQDPSADLTSLTNNGFGATAASSAEWSAQFNTPQFPWSESPLPSFFSQLPSWNQEMLRRARIGNTKPRLSEWDRKAQVWLSAAEIEKRQHSTKSEHTKTTESSAGNNGTANGADEAAEHDGEDENDDQAEDDMDIDNEEEDAGQARNVPSAKRRKQLAPEERTFEVKRWMQVPLAVAEKTEERKFLADRRAGMPSLYGGSYQNQVFQPLGLSQSGYTAYGTSNASYDLGDGSGLGTAVTQEQSAAPQAVRRNIPPKRKKKKGGPGRRKAPTTTGEAGAATNPATATALADGTAPGLASGGDAANGTQDQDVAMQDGDEDGSDSGDSEGEGSEEGEIDGGDDQAASGETKAQETVPLAEPAQVQPIEEAPVTDIDAETTQLDPAAAGVTEVNVPPLAFTASRPDVTAFTNTLGGPSPVRAVSPLNETEGKVQGGLEEATMIDSVMQPQPEIVPTPTEPPTVESTKPIAADALTYPPTAIPHDQPIDESTVVPISSILDSAPEATEETQPAVQLSESEHVPQPSTAVPVADLLTEAPPAPIPTLEPNPDPIEPPALPVEVDISIPEPLPPINTLPPTLEATQPEPISEVPPLPTSTAVPPQLSTAEEQRLQNTEGTKSPMIPNAATTAAATEPDLLGGLEDQVDKDMAGQ